MTDPGRPTPEQFEAEIASLRQRLAALEADLTAQHAVEQTAQRARHYAEHIVDTVHEPLLMLSQRPPGHRGQSGILPTLQRYTARDGRRLLYELGNQQWNIPQLRQLFEDLLPMHTTVDNFEVTHTFRAHRTPRPCA